MELDMGYQRFPVGRCLVQFDGDAGDHCRAHHCTVRVVVLRGDEGGKRRGWALQPDSHGVVYRNGSLRPVHGALAVHSRSLGIHAGASYSHDRRPAPHRVCTTGLPCPVRQQTRDVIRSMAELPSIHHGVGIPPWGIITRWRIDRL